MPLVSGCSDDAISANVSELMKSGKYDQKQAVAIAYANCREGKGLKSLFISAKPMGIFDHRAGLTVYKSEDGRRYLFIVTSNSYKDRENEAVATKALKSYVDSAWAVEDKCLPNNPLYFWHGGEPIGDIVWTDMKGPFLIEVARERKNKRIHLSRKHVTTVKQVWDAIEQSDTRWGASQGFRHFAHDRDKEGTYHNIYKFETSILPLEQAANQYTFSEVLEMTSRNEVLDEMLKIPSIGEQLTNGIKRIKRELDLRGLQHKELTTVKKGKLDEALSVIEAALAKIGTVPDGFAAQVLQDLVAAMSGSDTGMETATTDTEYMAADEVPMAPQTEDVMNKQLDLVERLINTQAAIVTDNLETKKALVEVGQGVSSLAQGLTPLPATLKAMDDRLAEVERKLAGAPRRASADAATVIDDKDLTKKVMDQVNRAEELFPGSGVMVTPKQNGR